MSAEQPIVKYNIPLGEYDDGYDFKFARNKDHNDVITVLKAVMGGRLAFYFTSDLFIY